ncbi:nickel pincer cofactor biosynthesis protein LarB [Acuticoccus sp. I52.16.1]|uniref:nickel pincer cofactor biosynthesis protein LarB n=1 Tax=Acuticoccus sp. I52.16.1 TaxID=2928472 RepID=UPI001FD14C75|nr:nickel pincer cofactor biosynthesis protein LarB [Acuticoccus sp. I52.16.1]UOM36928.1 nickel pincer cofactor biosynthesis protein LarB [Acuticoccus sp. I52.16.1]
MDWDREARTGLPEAVFCAGKTPAQIDAILAEARAAGRRVLLTRLDPARRDALAAKEGLDYDAASATAILGGPAPARPGRIAIVTGGLADLPAATEALRTLAFCGFAGELVADVGVAGLWRLLERIDAIREVDVVIAVAGMEGAIFSVLAGLVTAPIIALPVSFGSGVSAGGRLALDAALGSCAPGLVAVNIDNGFGAAQAAIRMLSPRGGTAQNAGPS